MIEVLDAKNGQSIVQLNGHTNSITTLSFSRDGSLLASSSRDQTAKLWRLPSGEPVGPPLRHSQAVVRAIFSSDARRLATATHNDPIREKSSIHTWDTATGKEIGSGIQSKDEVHALGFDPDNSRRLITGDYNRWLDVRDADSHLAIFPPLKFESSVVWAWACSPEGLRIAAGSDDGTARVWDLETGLPLTPSLRHAGWVTSVNFSPDGRHLLTTSEDGTAKIWDLGMLPEAAKPLQLDAAIRFRRETLESIHTWSSDGRRLLIDSQDQNLRMVNLETLRTEGGPMPSPDGDVAGALAFDTSSRQWAAALGMFNAETTNTSRRVRLWQEGSGEVRQLELKHPEAVRIIQFNIDGSKLFTWSDDARLRTWQTVDGTLVGEQMLPAGYRADLMALSQDGTLALLFREDDASSPRLFPEFFDWSKPEVAGVRPEVPREVTNTGWLFMTAFTFSPQGDRAAYVCLDQYGHIWDVRTGRESTPPFKQGGMPSWVEWSRDGRRVLTAGKGGMVKTWDAETGELAAPEMELSNVPVRVAHFSPDDRFVVARSDDHLVRVWDRATAEPVTPRLKHAGAVRAIMVTKHNRLVSVSAPAVIRAWDLSPTPLPAGTIADYARLLAGRTQDRVGGWRMLKPRELAELRQTLASNHPALFASEEKAIQEWHRRQIPEPTSLARVRAASFHLNQLASLDAQDPAIEKQRSEVEARRIPPRDPATPANLIDLSADYTHSFGVLQNQDFADLPTGVQTLAGTRFDVRGLVRLEAADFTDREFEPPFVLPAARNIRIGQRCRELHFLRAVVNARAEVGEQIARIVVHYADGSVRDSVGTYDDPTSGVSSSVIAWEGHPPIPFKTFKNGAPSVYLFKNTWTNPQPDVEITTLDFVLESAKARPFVVAITAE